MRGLSINVPLVEALEQMPGYAKFMKDFMTKNRLMNFKTIKVTHQVSAIVHSMALKLEDPGTFTIPCTIGSADFAKILCDLRMDDRTMKRPLGVIEDVLVRVDKFILPADFVILDYKVDYEVPIILGRSFLATSKALCDVEVRELTFWVGDEKSDRWFHGMCELFIRNGVIQLCTPKLSLDLENRKTPPTKPSIEEPPTLELKPLPPHLRYEFLGPCSTLPVILSSCLSNMHVDSTLAVLQKRKKAIG
ncbi:uncharacterized protein [Nicotiana tomentosiformis]|uniref:uncharacterized protein n=1 Tax=Nicotiana tomentosiformis TaxID=4098 RepID=UPI00388CD686